MKVKERKVELFELFYDLVFVYGSFFAVLGNFILLQQKSRMCMRGGAAPSE